MNYRIDKFSLGDKVTWFDDHYATFTRGRERYGDGPFEIVEIVDQAGKSLTQDGRLAMWEAMAHTQHVYIDVSSLAGNSETKVRFSGAFFKIV